MARIGSTTASKSAGLWGWRQACALEFQFIYHASKEHVAYTLLLRGLRHFARAMLKAADPYAGLLARWRLQQAGATRPRQLRMARCTLGGSPRPRRTQADPDCDV